MNIEPVEETDIVAIEAIEVGVEMWEPTVATRQDDAPVPVSFERTINYNCIREEVSTNKEVTILALVSFGLMGAVMVGAIIWYLCCGEKKKEEHGHDHDDEKKEAHGDGHGHEGGDAEDGYTMHA